MRPIARCAVFLSAVLAAGAAVLVAQGPVKDPAMSHRHDDPKLTWSPCPDILGKGCEVTVLHGDPAGGRSDVFVKVPAGHKFPPHAHTSPEHMILVAGELQVKYEGQPAQTLRTGSFAYGPAKRGHEAQCGAGGPCVLFIAFEGPIDAMPFSGKL